MRELQRLEGERDATMGKPACWYNEICPRKAAMLRQMIEEGLIMRGEVDERSIIDVHPDDLKGFIRCAFFAGVGGWEFALRRAEWPEDREVWTGSPPCQGFSSAGKQEGFEDPRDLWPVWFRRFIDKRRPATVFGEEVERAISHGWLDRVHFDMDSAAYASVAAVLPACAINAPHRRDRLAFASYSTKQGLEERRSKSFPASRAEQRLERHGSRGELADNGRGRVRGSGRRGDYEAAREISEETREQWLWPNSGKSSRAIGCELSDTELRRRDQGLSGDGCGKEGAGRPHRQQSDRYSGAAGAMADHEDIRQDRKAKARKEARHGLEDSDLADRIGKRGRGGRRGREDAGYADVSGEEGRRAVSDSSCPGRNGRPRQGLRAAEGQEIDNGHFLESAGLTYPNFSDCGWVLCGDGKIRRTPAAPSGVRVLDDGFSSRGRTRHAKGDAEVQEKEEFRPALLAHGYPYRRHLLHAAGDAIVTGLFARFIKAADAAAQEMGLGV